MCSACVGCDGGEWAGEWVGGGKGGVYVEGRGGEGGGVVRECVR